MKIKAILTGLPIALACTLVHTSARCQAKLDTNARNTFADSNTSARYAKVSILEKFDQNLAPNAAERYELKAARRDEINERMALLDSLEISDRRRSRLIRELYNNPLSKAWDKVLATTVIEDEDPD